MWIRVVHLVVKYQAPLIIAIAIMTLFMGYHALQVKVAHVFVSTLPANDPEQRHLNEFKKQFGEDGNIMAIGMKDSSIFELAHFIELQKMCEELAAIQGVSSVVSLPQIKKVEKNTRKKRFALADVFSKQVERQSQLDSLLKEARAYPFYTGQVVNTQNGAIAILIGIESTALNSSARMGITNRIMEVGKRFSDQSGITLHYAGLPIIRSVITGRIASELKMFLMLSVVITGIVLFFFFRSFRVVMMAMTVIGIAVIWSVGAVKLLGFELTLLSGMIPPIMVVIGIPNTIYLTNRYQTEYLLHGRKILALGRVIQKVGLATFLTNLTTAIGFLVLLSTKISILREFGIVAGLNVLSLFLISLVLIPSMLSWIYSPSRAPYVASIRSLERILSFIDRLVQRKRHIIYSVTLTLVGVALVGIDRLNALSYVADDLPKGSQVKKDLAFFERNFDGVMPLEIVVDTQHKRGVLRLKNMKKIEELETFVASQKDISNPISLIGLIKASRQAFYNNNPNRYALPNKRDLPFIVRYMKGQTQDVDLLKAFVDPDMQKMRISYHMVDIGSHNMDSLVNQVIRPKIAELFADTPITAVVTGTSPVFVQGNKFLISSLKYSLLLAFGLISIIIGILFTSVRMVIVSLIPNLIPMMVTAAMMGYLEIPLKPSSALIFSIIFGISIDFSIHFLAKYRQNLDMRHYTLPQALSNTILEVGKSMIHTSIVLFCGFIIFAFSSFGGTISLGLLTSTTLAMSVVTNLIILPSLIITFNRKAYHAALDADARRYGERASALHGAKSISS